MKKANQLTRNCSICGQKKPLSAFLQLGKSGAIYGSICGACRGTLIEPPVKEDDHTTSSPGLKLDSKTKARADADKKNYFQRLELNNEDEKKKKEQVNTEKLDKTDKIKKAEKTHRQDFLEVRKQDSFLGTMNKKAEIRKQVAAIQQKRDVTNTIKTRVANQAEHEAKNISEVNKQEEMLNSTDMSIQYVDPQISQLKYQSAVFQQFRTWLGGSAPISRTLNQMFGNKEPKAQATPQTPAQKDEQKKSNDPAVEYINKSWQSTKRR